MGTGFLNLIIYQIDITRTATRAGDGVRESGRQQEQLISNSNSSSVVKTVPLQLFIYKSWSQYLKSDLFQI